MIEDIREAINFVKEEFGSDIESIKSLKASSEITYEYLWALFSPGTIIYSEIPHLPGIAQCLRIRNVTYRVATIGPDPPEFIMSCWVLNHDGEHFGLSRTLYPVGITEFAGALPITELPNGQFPLEFHPQGEAMRARLIAQGKAFVELSRRPSYKEFKGFRLRQKWNAGKNEYELRKFMVSKIIS